MMDLLKQRARRARNIFHSACVRAGVSIYVCAFGEGGMVSQGAHLAINKQATSTGRRARPPAASAKRIKAVFSRGGKEGKPGPDD